MASLGTFILLATFVIAAYAAAASVGGARRRDSRLIESGVGAFYQADACEDQTDTAGWFVTVRPADTSFAFYTAVEPLEAMPDHVAALQAILDSVRFHAS
mgnify:CR=1 FL=1